MTKTLVHIFIGEFENREDACSYSQPQWEPEPHPSVTDEEYQKWEDNNPQWKMRDDLNCYLDADFIETITDNNKLNYFKGLVNNDQLTNTYSELLSAQNSALILIFERALDEKNIEMRSTNRMKYIGKFATKI